MSGCTQTYGSIARALGASKAWLPERCLDAMLAELQALNPALELVEPLGGNPVACRDIRALAAEARAEVRPLVVDGSAIGVEGCAGVRLGAHVELIALGDACLVVLSADAERVLPGLRERLDGMDAPSEERLAEHVERLAQMDEAWRRRSDAAQVVASYLRCHPSVRHVAYPGLKGDASFEVAARTLQHGFGPCVSWQDARDGGWHKLCCTAEDARSQVMRLEEELSPRA